MVEVVYPPVILVAKGIFRALGLRFDIAGTEHIPSSGGAVLASNHVSYLDFIFCGLAAHPADRYVRFMAKKEVFDHAVSGPLMRAMKHISVDRSAGAGSYDDALAALRSGEVVGVFPEATISRALTPKDFKTGAARLARTAGVPLVPMAVWGTQRLWTKGRPRNFTTRGFPVVIRVGEPVPTDAADDPADLTAELKSRIEALVADAQAAYPDTPAPGESPWWLPAHLGGSAPTLAEAAATDQAVAARRRAQRGESADARTEAPQPLEQTPQPDDAPDHREPEAS